jgi:hypothetical protein
MLAELTAFVEGFCPERATGNARRLRVTLVLEAGLRRIGGPGVPLVDALVRDARQGHEGGRNCLRLRVQCRGAGAPRCRPACANGVRLEFPDATEGRPKASPGNSNPTLRWCREGESNPHGIATGGF